MIPLCPLARSSPCASPSLTYLPYSRLSPLPLSSLSSPSPLLPNTQVMSVVGVLTNCGVLGYTSQQLRTHLEVRLPAQAPRCTETAPQHL